MAHTKIVGSAFAAAFGLLTLAGTASAMPLERLGAAAAQGAVVQEVRLVCGPYRCWRQPGIRYYDYYGYGYGPRWGRPWGWYGRW